MITSLNYDSGQGLLLRLRNAAGLFYDFMSHSFVEVEIPTCRVALADIPNGDGMSLYVASVGLPDGYPYIQEILLPTGEVITSGEATEPATAAQVQAVTDIADPLATIVPDSDPPITRGEAIDRLYIPAYVGPVAVKPASADPVVQFVHFFGKKGDGTASSSRAVTAVPIAGQVIDTSLVDKQVLQRVLDADGYAYLELLKGVLYTISAPWWGPSLDVLITLEDSADFSSYAAGALELPEQVVLGAIRFGDRYIRPTLTDADGNVVPLGTVASLDGLTLGWEIV